jgi:hypothetical protein
LSGRFVKAIHFPPPETAPVRDDIMPERHTIDFARGSFNLVTDADRRTITLQFEDAFRALPGRRHRRPSLEWRIMSLRFEDAFPGGRVVSESIDRILKALRQRFGGGILGGLNRWSRRERNPLVLPRRGHPHLDNPDVLCFEIGVKDGAKVEAALATLLDFLRRQPGYQRTYGAPLDRDAAHSEERFGPDKETSTAARDVFIGLLARLSRRNDPPPTRT